MDLDREPNVITSIGLDSETVARSFGDDSELNEHLIPLVEALNCVGAFDTLEQSETEWAHLEKFLQCGRAISIDRDTLLAVMEDPNILEEPMLGGSIEARAMQLVTTFLTAKLSAVQGKSSVEALYQQILDAETDWIFRTNEELKRRWTQIMHAADNDL